MSQVINQQLVDRFEEFYREYYQEEIGKLLENYPDRQRSIEIDLGEVYRFDPNIADDYISHPDKIQEAAEEALKNIGDIHYPTGDKLEKAHIRIFNLPETTDIREIRSKDVNTLVAIQGLIRKATDVRPKVETGAFECQRCASITEVLQVRGYQEPYMCDGCERQGPFEIDFSKSTFSDSQTLLIQESPEGLKGGEQPQSIEIHIEDEISGKVNPGDRVIATGTLRIEQRKRGGEKSRIFEVYMEGSSIISEEIEFENIEISKEDENAIIQLSKEEGIYQKMIESIAPSIYGYDEEKMAITLQLFSGVTKHLPDSTRIRGNIHILLVGDPGTGKSQLLQYIRHIAPRSIYTSGKGSSSAGLTAAAVKDDFGGGQQWSLEAGALVLADKGIAAVDEIDKMRVEDRSAMHEALEQQTVSIAKAGINATLKCRCSLLGAANPKYGQYDVYESIGDQINLEPALISRFDLIFTIEDEPNAGLDDKIATHIIKTNYVGERGSRAFNLLEYDESEEDLSKMIEEIEPAIEPSLFRKYIAYAKRNCFPVMSEEAQVEIKKFYVGLRAVRNAENRGPIPVTARKLEALIRLAEASARVRLSEVVDKNDATRVISIVRSSLEKVGIDPETGAFDATVIEMGKSKTQFDRVKVIQSIVEELEKQSHRGAFIEDIIGKAVEKGIERSQAERHIKGMTDRGELYQPENGYLRRL
jgi:replicative DNA helicase Mcm